MNRADYYEAVSKCVNAPHDEGPFRYCNVKGCPWTEEGPLDGFDDDEFEQIRGYEGFIDAEGKLIVLQGGIIGAISGRVNTFPVYRRKSDLSGGDGGGSESQVAPGLRVSDGTADPSTTPEHGRTGAEDD